MKFECKDLISQGIVKAKTYTEGPYAGLSVLKYSNSVFWDNRWGEDSRLLDCRGMVVDQDDNVIIWPFTKIFNRFENDTDLPLDQKVTCVRKVNGFMGAMSVYKGELIVSTTGTLDSEFAQMAKEKITAAMPDGMLDYFVKNAGPCTLIFEICDDSDPHIIAEEAGAYLIGCRVHLSGGMLPEWDLDRVAERYGWKRAGWEVIPFGDVVYNSKVIKHEGYVIRDANSGELLLKIKSPHYLTKKFFMRGSVKKCEAIWEHGDRVKQIVEEEYYPLVDFIKTTFTKEQWLVMNEQQRGTVIAQFLEGD